MVTQYILTYLNWNIVDFTFEIENVLHFKTQIPNISNAPCKLRGLRVRLGYETWGTFSGWCGPMTHGTRVWSWPCYWGNRIIPANTLIWMAAQPPHCGPFPSRRRSGMLSKQRHRTKHKSVTFYTKQGDCFAALRVSLWPHTGPYYMSRAWVSPCVCDGVIPHPPALFSASETWQCCTLLWKHVLGLNKRSSLGLSGMYPGIHIHEHLSEIRNQNLIDCMTFQAFWNACKSSERQALLCGFGHKSPCGLACLNFQP